MSRPGGHGGPPQQPPLSFKTVPGRNRTQKWNQAKTYNYDGDDWGGFDAYDEYGTGPNDEAQTPSHQYAPPQPGMARQQSFEQGSERRQFSAPVYPQSADRRPSPAISGSSSAGSDHGRQRQYSNPGQQPPLMQQSRGSSQPPSVIARKASSTSVDNSPRPSSPASKSEKPLPFIRPSDIYKRMAEEKEKERLSIESSRPSMESLQREGTPNSAQRPLSTVQERPGSTDISTILAAHSPTTANTAELASPHLTEHQSTIVPPPPPGAVTGQSTEGQHSLHSIVQDAFHRGDSTSTTTSDITRSNTDSTSGISPIISRIPSAVNADQRAQPRNFPVYPIQEEPARSQHSRNVSAETMTPSTYQNLDSAVKPNLTAQADSPACVTVGHESPARTPVFDNVETRRLSGPLAAESAEEATHPPFDAAAEQTSTGRPRAGTDYSLREADLAREASIAHNAPQPEIRQAQQHMQHAFLTERSPEVAEAPQLRREWSFDASPGLEDIRPKNEELSIPTRPIPSHADSFRPQVPGGWVSAAATPAMEKAAPILPVLSPPSPLHTERTSAQQSPSIERDDVDFTPTSSTSAVRHTPQGNQVRDAGVALGAAFLSSQGTNHQSHDFASLSDAAQPELLNTQQRGPSGDVYARHPLHRELSSAPSESNASLMSDAPPTPPVKDYSHPAAKTPQASLPSVSHVNTNASLDQDVDDEGWTGNSPGSSINEYESDRLHRDIVKSLDMSNSPAARSAHLGDADANAAIVSPVELTRPPNNKAAHLADQPATISSRPGLLDQRFSWESQPQVSAPAAEALSAPKMPIALVGELPGDKGRLSYERPDDGRPLHVTNAPKEELLSPIVSPITNDSIDTPLTAISSNTEKLDVPGSIDRNELSPSPVSMGESSHIPSYYAGITDEQIGKSDSSPNESPQIPQTMASEVSSAPVASDPKHDRQSSRIPPFREILAMKTPSERINAYTGTRYTFADMDTGLGDWLATVFAAHPEHEDLKSASRVSYDENTYGRGHRANPSLFKTNQFDGTTAKTFPNAARMSDVGPAPPPKDFNESSRQQMEKMQAKGKDIMKSAGVLGGKAQAGAKGLLAKGRNRFARTGEKVSNHPDARPVSVYSEEGMPPVSNNAVVPSEPPNPSSAPPLPASPADVEGRRSSFIERVRRRSKSMTRTRSRPVSTILLADASLAAEAPKSDGEAVRGRHNNGTFASRVRSRSRSLGRIVTGLLSGREVDEIQAAQSDQAAKPVQVDESEHAIQPLPATPTTAGWRNSMSEQVRSRSRSFTRAITRPMSFSMSGEDRERQRLQEQARSSSRPESLVMLPSWSHGPIEAVPPINIEQYRQSTIEHDNITALPLRPVAHQPDIAKVEQAHHDAQPTASLVSKPSVDVTASSMVSRAELSAPASDEAISTHVQTDIMPLEETRLKTDKAEPVLMTDMSATDHGDLQEREDAGTPGRTTAIRKHEPEAGVLTDTHTRRTSDLITLPSQLRAFALAKSSENALGYHAREYEAVTSSPNGDASLYSRSTSFEREEPAKEPARAAQSYRMLHEEDASAGAQQPVELMHQQDARRSDKRVIPQDSALRAPEPPVQEENLTSSAPGSKDAVTRQRAASITSDAAQPVLAHEDASGPLPPVVREAMQPEPVDPTSSKPSLPTSIEAVQPALIDQGSSRPTPPVLPEAKQPELHEIRAPETLPPTSTKAVQPEYDREPDPASIDTVLARSSATSPSRHSAILSSPTRVTSYVLLHNHATQAVPNRSLSSSSNPSSNIHRATDADKPEPAMQLQSTSNTEPLSPPTSRSSAVQNMPQDYGNRSAETVRHQRVTAHPPPNVPREVAQRHSVFPRRDSSRRRPVPPRMPTSSGTETPLEEKLDRSFATSTFAIDLSTLGHTSRQLSDDHPAFRGRPEERAMDMVEPERKPVQAASKHRVSEVPSTRDITDQHGLEGVEDFAIDQDVPTQPEQKSQRRRSSMWDNLKRMRSSSADALNRAPGTDSRGTPADLSIQAAPQQRVSDQNRTTLKKERPASTALEATSALPQKRNSTFGSLFGRSRAPEQKNTKAVKLSKKRSNKGDGTPDPAASAPTLPLLDGPMKPDYASYEASRRHDMVLLDHGRPHQDERRRKEVRQQVTGRDDGLSETKGQYYGRSRVPPPTFEPGHAWYNHFYHSAQHHPDPQPGYSKQEYRPSDHADGLSYHKVRGHGLQTDMETGPAALVSPGRIDPYSPPEVRPAMPGQRNTSAPVPPQITRFESYLRQNSQPRVPQVTGAQSGREMPHEADLEYHNDGAEVYGSTHARQSPARNGIAYGGDATDFDFGFDHSQRRSPVVSRNTSDQWPPSMRGASYPGQEWVPSY